MEDKRKKKKKQDGLTDQQVLDILQEEFFFEMEDVLKTVNVDLL